MNPVSNLLSRSIVRVVELTEEMNPRTKQAIRQGFVFIALVMIIVGIILGYTWGKGSARKMGVPLAEYTDQVFTTDIKREHQEGRFRSMLDSELMEEAKEIGFTKHKFPANEKLQPDLGKGIIEPSMPEKQVKAPPELDMRDRIAEMDRFDEKPKKPEVRNLQRRVPSMDDPEKPEIIKDKKEDLLMKELGGERKEKRPDSTLGIEENKKSKHTIEKSGKGKKPKTLEPIDKKTGIIEK